MSGTSQHEGYRRSRTREEGRIAGGGPGEDRKATWKAHVCPRYTSQPPARPCAPTTGKRYCICSTEILVIFLLHKAFLIQLLVMLFFSPISDCSTDNLLLSPQVTPSTATLHKCHHCSNGPKTKPDNFAYLCLKLLLSVMFLLRNNVIAQILLPTVLSARTTGIQKHSNHIFYYYLAYNVCSFSECMPQGA